MVTRIPLPDHSPSHACSLLYTHAHAFTQQPHRERGKIHPSTVQKTHPSYAQDSRDGSGPPRLLAFLHTHHLLLSPPFLSPLLLFPLCRLARRASTVSPPLPSVQKRNARCSHYAARTRSFLHGVAFELTSIGLPRPFLFPSAGSGSMLLPCPFQERSSLAR